VCRKCRKNYASLARQKQAEECGVPFAGICLQPLFLCMVQFSTTILRFDKQGEKTGWTYIEIPAKIAEQLKPGNKKSFRVKGKLDNYPIKGIALIPMGEGDFIMALNATLRKGIGKRKGDKLRVQLEVDNKMPEISADLLECLADETAAQQFFNSLPNSHRLYISKWIESAKTAPTKAKRIAMALNALSRNMGFGEMLREARDKKI